MGASICHYELRNKEAKSLDGFGGVDAESEELCDARADKAATDKGGMMMKQPHLCGWPASSAGSGGPEPTDDGLFIEIIDKLEEHDEYLSHHETSSSAGSDIQSDVGSDAVDEDVHDNQELDCEANYTPLATHELTAAWHSLRHCELPHQSGFVERLIVGVTRAYASEPNVIHLDRPSGGNRFIVVGDLHGHFGDLMHLLDEHGMPQEGQVGTSYLFNGDFVDRGAYGPEVMLCLYCLKLLYPKSVHLNRGNHEDISQNSLHANGFRHEHCERAFTGRGHFIYRLCRRSFRQLPLAHIIGNEVFVVHGGLPLDRHVTINEIQTIDRRRDVPTTACRVLGYIKHQRVRAKRDLYTKNHKKIQAGKSGVLVSCHKKRAVAEVAFMGHEEDLTTINVAGSPEQEHDIEIVYGSKEEAQNARLDRIFTALLWSDIFEPNVAKSAGPNSRRGAGAIFDENMTHAFLKENRLKCLFRSHEKRQTGFREEQRWPDGTLAAATIFSASNYPGGAGEPNGNAASVVVLYDVGQSSALVSTAATLKTSEPWKEAYAHLDRWMRPGQNSALHHAASQGDLLTEKKGAKTTRAQALEQLWLMIYCARPELLAYFNRVDAKETGTISFPEWIAAMRACVVLDDDFPWERISRHLCTFDPDGRCHYGAFLARYKNKLASRLERIWCAKVFRDLHSSIGGEGQAAAEWKRLDIDGMGNLSYSELRPLLKAHMVANEDVDDDRVYTLLSKMDKDHSGYVERDEFLRAVASGAMDDASNQGFDDMAVEACWSGLHGALRALSASRCRSMTVFRMIDKNGNGVLSRNEFQVGLEEILRGSALDTTAKGWGPLLWKLVDEDSSGFVDPTEFESALRVQDVKAGFPAETGADVNRSGGLCAFCV